MKTYVPKVSIVPQVQLDVFNPARRLCSLLEKNLNNAYSCHKLSCGVKIWNYFACVSNLGGEEYWGREIHEWNDRSKRLECRLWINHTLFKGADDSMRMMMLKVSLLKCLDFLDQQHDIVANIKILQECTNEVCDSLIAKLTPDAENRVSRRKAR